MNPHFIKILSMSKSQVGCVPGHRSKAQGVEIWGMTVQNEPLNNATWEACHLVCNSLHASSVLEHDPACQSVPQNVIPY